MNDPSDETPTDPLVSVIIPATRDDSWLREAIQSVRDDGYRNLEVILVWDGNPKDAPSLESVDTLIVTGGVGTPQANNAGLRAARGEFVARLDSDDITYPGRFTAQVNAFRSCADALLVATEALVIDGESRPLRDYPRPAVRRVPIELLTSNTLVHSTFMFRAGQDVAYDPRCIRMQDYELAMRIAQDSPVIVLDQNYVGYRVHPNQSGRKTTAFWQYIPVVLGRRRALARSQGMLKWGSQWIRDAAWFAAQYVNHKGWRDRYRALRSG